MTLMAFHKGGTQPNCHMIHNLSEFLANFKKISTPDCWFVGFGHNSGYSPRAL